jgi:Arm DNA-binding domain
MARTRSPEQIMRRLRRSPRDGDDLRFKNDPYWILRCQGYPHAYAKRMLRTEKIVVTELMPYIDLDPGEYAAGVPREDLLWDPDEPIYPPPKIQVAIRPERLTDQVIQDAKPLRRDEYTIWDRTVPSLGLRVRKSGHRSFILCYRVRGKRKSRKFTIAKAGAITLDRARDIAREFLAHTRTGKDPIQLFLGNTPGRGPWGYPTARMQGVQSNVVYFGDHKRRK